MQRIVTKLVVGMAITAIGVFAADSSAATWKFNAAKSKTTSANPIKSQTDVRETTPDGGVSVTRTGQFKDGTPNEGTYSYKYDGYGNWTEQTTHSKPRPDGASEDSAICRRTITYY